MTNKFKLVSVYIPVLLVLTILTPGLAAAQSEEPTSATTQPSEKTGRFFESLNQAESVKMGTSPLTGRIVDDSLQIEDSNFQKLKAKQKDHNQTRIYDDLVKSNSFMGNPVLIRLDPPDEEVALKNQRRLRDELGTLVSGDKPTAKQFEGGLKDITNADRQYYGYLARELKQAQRDFSDSQQDTLVKREHETSKYLLVLNYNIPAVRTGLFGQNFRIVRVGVHAFLRNQQENQSSSDYERINLVSIYPTSELLKADLDDSKTFEAQVEGSWGGATAGHAKYSQTRDWKYAVNFPRVVGLGTADGTMQWVYYPAKAQEITFGNKTAFALFTVPSDLSASGVLQLNALLEYRMRLLKVGTTPTSTRMVSLYTPLNAALHRKKDIDNFARMFGRTLPPSDEKELQRLLRTTDDSTTIDKKNTNEKSK